MRYQGLETFPDPVAEVAASELRRARTDKPARSVAEPVNLHAGKLRLTAQRHDAGKHIS